MGSGEGWLAGPRSYKGMIKATREGWGRRERPLGSCHMKH